MELLLANGAIVINGDVVAPPTQPTAGTGTYTFIQTDVTSWAQLNNLFKQTKAQHARIDHVFLNAGLGPRTDYLATDVDENGDLKEPSTALLDVSLKGVMNTGTLAIYYMRQQAEGGSIVVNASVMGIQRCRAVDYGGSIFFLLASPPRPPREKAIFCSSSEADTQIKKKDQITKKKKERPMSRSTKTLNLNKPS